MTAEFDDLAPEEVRVLGCLIEKEATTPDTYPLTLNALRTACNQSSSRHPVVSYDAHTVERALATLRGRGLTRTVHSTSNRAAKYRHVVSDVLDLDPAGMAVLSVLMLRGPQTVGELKGRTERQHSFDSLDETAAVLDQLAAREPPLVRHLPRQPGQKDARWIQLLAPFDDDSTSAKVSAAESASPAPAAAAESTESYGTATAEFYELFATAHWERSGLELAELLDGVDPTAGPIVDVGAGTGSGLPYFLAALPDAEIHAIEPSKAMRTAFHTRLALDPALRGRVTVDPRPLAQALPEDACAVVLSSVLGHLTDDECRTLWRFLTDRMPAGAPTIIELLPPHRSTTIEPTRYASVQVGRFAYEGWQSGEAVDDRTMRWTMTYRVLDGDTIVVEHEATSLYRCWSPDDVRLEVEPLGLTVTEHGDAVVIRR